MIKILVAATAALLLMQQPTTPSFAQSGNRDPRLELLLQKLQKSLVPPRPQVPVNRTFTLRVRWTVVVKSAPPPTHTVMCELFLANTSIHAETESTHYAVPNTGGSFVCDITKTVEWPFADTASPVIVELSLRAAQRDESSLPGGQEYARSRSLSVSLKPIPLPNEGEVVELRAESDF